MELKPSQLRNPLRNAAYNFQQQQLLHTSIPVLCCPVSHTYLRWQRSRTQGHCWSGRWLGLGACWGAAAGQHLLECLLAQNRERSAKWQEAGDSPHSRFSSASKAAWHCSAEQNSAVLVLRGCNSLRSSPRTCRGHSSFPVLETCLWRLGCGSCHPHQESPQSEFCETCSEGGNPGHCSSALQPPWGLCSREKDLQTGEILELPANKDLQRSSYGLGYPQPRRPSKRCSPQKLQNKRFREKYKLLTCPPNLLPPHIL